MIYKRGIKIKGEVFRKFFFIFVLVGMLILSLLIIWPFFTGLLTSFVIAYIFYPVYKLFYRKFKNKNLAAIIVTVLIILIIVVPFFLMFNTISKQALFFYSSYLKDTSISEILGGQCFDQNIFCNTVNKIIEWSSNPNVQQYLSEPIKLVVNFFVDKIKNFVISIPNLFLNLFIMLYTTFFLFRDGKNLLEKLVNLLPLKKGHKKDVLKKINDSAFAIIYGTITVAIIQGILGGIGFYFAGVEHAVIWSLIIMVFAVIPIVGTAAVWVPVSIFLIVNGYITGESIVLIKGIGLFLYGMFVISMIDNFLKPKLIGDRAKVHPVLVLLGVLGGIQLFGFIGFIIGPVILALLIAFIKIYEEEGFF